MMPRFGAHAYTWIGEWDDETGQHAILQAASTGLDLLEIPLSNPTDFHASTVKRQLAKYGIEGVCTLVLPPHVHLPAKPKQALAFLKQALEQVDALGATFLGGVLYANVGTLTLQPPTKEERERCVQVLSEVAADAARRGITLGIEPVNRYESYMYNSVADVLTLIEAVGASNITLHLDTHHMNIEEQGFFEPVKHAGQRLSYVHASESDRGLVVGKGNVHWNEFFAGLAAINYRGPLVLESFATEAPSMIAAACLWHPSPYTPDQLVRDGIVFLREEAAKVGLP